MSESTCSADGCANGGKLVRGLCNMHYKRWRRTGEIGEPQSRRHERGECSIDGCSESHESRGYCNNHYRYLLRYGVPEKPVRVIPDCSIDGCSNRAEKRGWCGTHYARWRIRGTTDDPVPVTHCPQGHEYTEENTRIDKAGARNCRRCAAARTRAQWSALPVETRRERKRRSEQADREHDPERYRERRNKVSRTYRLANRDKYAIYSANRRAIKMAAYVEDVDVEVVLAEHGMTCHICSHPIPSRADLHLDHVIPLARGGLHAYSNIRPAHATCNIRKGTKLLSELRE